MQPFVRKPCSGLLLPGVWLRPKTMLAIGHLQELTPKHRALIPDPPSPIPHPRWPRLLFLAVVVAFCVGGFFALPLRADEPLLEGEPFDLITLNKANDNKVLKVKPLDLPNRQLPAKPRPRDKLVVRLLDHPETDYEIEWHSIEKVELFEQLVLGKANQLVADKKLDEAYDYFAFLLAKYPRLAGLEESVQSYLYEQAKASQIQESYAGALAALRELYQRNPKWPGLDKAMGLSTDKLVEGYLAKGDYRSARALLRNLSACFPGQAVVVAREGQLKSEAAGLLAEASKAEQAGDFQQAVKLIERVELIWPQLPGAKDLAIALHRKSPRVVLGVSEKGTSLISRSGKSVMSPFPLGDWAARRSGRLLYRTLTEYAGPGAEGGVYTCPVGKVSIAGLERRLSVQLAPNIRWCRGRRTLSGYDVSRLLLAMADPLDPTYRVEWAELLGGVEVRDVYRVEVQMRRSHVRPDALLQIVLLPYGGVGDGGSGTADGGSGVAETLLASGAGSPPLSNGPYMVDVDSCTQEEMCYLPNQQYFAAQPGQPRVIVERCYAEGAEAVRALQREEVLVLDRVDPWLLGAIRGDGDLRLDCYRVPLVHCLIPNMRRPLTSRRTFRRALVYGIHRQAILDHLLAGEKLEGCQVLSGPFPPGRSGEDDPIGYAYDEGIKPRDYDPGLAVALARISLEQLADAEKQEGRELKQMPRLVLAHPADEIARVACRSIQQELDPLGIHIDLKELPSPLPERIPEDVDLLYAELAIWEPVVDARRLLGENGISAGCSPYMSLALRKLDEAGNWREVSQALRQIHRVAHDDVAVVPLWQLVDYFAYHQSLHGIGPQPVTLYQDIEQWRPSFRYPEQ
jgi:ABC-type transport system substrate-binding protein